MFTLLEKKSNRKLKTINKNCSNKVSVPHGTSSYFELLVDLQPITWIKHFSQGYFLLICRIIGCLRMTPWPEVCSWALITVYAMYIFVQSSFSFLKTCLPGSTGVFAHQCFQEGIGTISLNWILILNEYFFYYQAQWWEYIKDESQRWTSSVWYLPGDF